MAWKLALHTGTIRMSQSTSCCEVARETGWDAVELRYLDFERAMEAGRSIEDILALVKASGLPVSRPLGFSVAGCTRRARSARSC